MFCPWMKGRIKQTRPTIVEMLCQHWKIVVKQPPLIESKSRPPVLEKKRYHDLDALRAFAMLLGIALHGVISFFPVFF